MAPPMPHPMLRDAAPSQAGLAEPVRTRGSLPARDDALARAARDVAAPRRRLLAALRDAHADAAERIAALRRCDGALKAAAREPLLRGVLARLLGQAEEQHRRLEILFAQLRERPGAGLVGAAGPDLAAVASRRDRDHQRALLIALEAEEASGARDAEALRDLARIAGQHLVARLLDLTAAERSEAARDLAALARHLDDDGEARPARQ